MTTIGEVIGRGILVNTVVAFLGGGCVWRGASGGAGRDSEREREGECPHLNGNMTVRRVDLISILNFFSLCNCVFGTPTCFFLVRLHILNG